MQRRGGRFKGFPGVSLRNAIVRSICSLAVSTVLLGAADGCSKQGTAPKPVANDSNGIGVVDLDRVSKAMGWTEDIQKDLRTADAEIKRVIESRMKAVQGTFDQKKKAIADEAKLTAEQIVAMNNAHERTDLDKLGLTTKQIDDLAQAASVVQVEANSVASEEQQLIQQRAAAITRAYREGMAPVIRRVAAANGRRVVVAPSESLVYFDPNVDLTDRLVEELQKSPPIKVELPEMLKAVETPAATQP